ncbi:MAG: DUF3421 domain-containing protein [Leptospiraceae bacterium]|nr:DUF3421 domain-containing protein [Leptospiraceae bacterium]MCP5499769.1 DUF3421 domain-containing protein [Leptospiraceae bacterium]
MKRSLVFLFFLLTLSLEAGFIGWVKYTGKVPHRAKWVGLEERFPDGSKKEVYICRAEYKDILHPGRMRDGKCIISVDGKEILFSEFELFFHGSEVSLKAFKGNTPKNAITAGGSIGNLFFLCVLKHNGSWLPGKLYENECKIGYGGTELSFKEKFYVLVKK